MIQLLEMLGTITLVSARKCPRVSTCSRKIKLFNKNPGVKLVALPFKNVCNQLIYKNVSVCTISTEEMETLPKLT